MAGDKVLGSSCTSSASTSIFHYSRNLWFLSVQNSISRSPSGPREVVAAGLLLVFKPFQDTGVGANEVEDTSNVSSVSQGLCYPPLPDNHICCPLCLERSILRTPGVGKFKFPSHHCSHAWAHIMHETILVKYSHSSAINMALEDCLFTSYMSWVLHFHSCNVSTW